MVLDPGIDRSSIKLGNLTQSAKVEKEEMFNLGVVDIYRAQSKLKREYSFHSPLHNSCSVQIDILGPFSKLHLIPACEYLAKTITDHTALLVTIAASDVTKPLRVGDLAFIVDYLYRHIDTVLTFNPNSSTTDIMRDSLKAYLRLFIICYT